MSYYKSKRDIVNHIKLSAISVAATTGYMLIDLSDVSNWPHINTGHIDIDNVHINFNPDASFKGTVAIGFLASVDASNGNLYEIYKWHFEQAIANDGIVLADKLDFGGEEHFFHCGTERHFGLIGINDTTFQTDVNIAGPDGNVSYPSGNGDLVLKIVRTAGIISVGIDLEYTTHP